MIDDASSLINILFRTFDPNIFVKLTLSVLYCYH